MIIICASVLEMAAVLFLLSLCLHLVATLTVQNLSPVPDSARLECDGAGSSGVSWFKDNQAVNFSDARISSEDGHLCIRDIQVSDEALYKCCFEGVDCSSNSPIYGN